MSDQFDPYYKWLGIPPAEQPPNHYRLLGVPPFVDDLDVIENAADQRMGHIRTFQSGKHSALSQKILNELSSARVCLLNPNNKTSYDQQLRAQLATDQLIGLSDIHQNDPFESGSGIGFGIGLGSGVAAGSGIGTPPTAAYPAQTVAPQPVIMQAGKRHDRPAAKQKPKWLLPALLGGGSGVILIIIVIGLLAYNSPDPVAVEQGSIPPASKPAGNPSPPKTPTTALDTNVPEDDYSPPIPFSPPPTPSIENDKQGLVGRARRGQHVYDVLLNYKSSGVLSYGQVMRMISSRTSQSTSLSVELQFDGLIELDKPDRVTIQLQRGSIATLGSSIVSIDGNVVAQNGGNSNNGNDVSVDLNLDKGQHLIAWKLNGSFHDCRFQLKDSNGIPLRLLHDDAQLTKARAGTSEELVLGLQSSPETRQRAVQWVIANGGRVEVRYFTTRGMTAQNVDRLENIPNDFFLVRGVHFSVRSSYPQVDDKGILNLKGLCNLESVHLRGTRITDASMSVFSELQGLYSLGMSQCSSVSDRGMPELAKLTGLRYLALAGTQVTARGIEHLKALPNLQTLNLSTTKFTELEAQCLTEMPMLRTLYLDGVQTLSVECLEKVAMIQRLQFLVLSSSNLDDNGLASVGKISTLGTLNLDSTGITDSGLEQITNLSNLTSVNLDSTKITDRGLEEIKNLPNLSSLFLQNVPGITNDGVGSLANIQSLRTLYLTSNRQITDAEPQSTSVR